MAHTKPKPPSRFIIRALKEFLTASSVFVNPIRKNEQSVVISQKKNSQTRSFENTMPYIAARKRNSRKKNHGLLSGAPWL